jgi:hypothetical protein
MEASMPAKIRLILPLALVFMLGAAGVVPGERPASPTCGDVFGASVCTWAVKDGDHVLEVGATIPMTLVENAPAEREMTWPPAMEADIPLPPEAAAIGFRHLTVFWEPHGHPPGPYLVPHFDFHFYSIPTEETMAIDCSDETKPTVLPAGYVSPDIEIPEIGNLVGLCVPQMGMHALPEAEIESDSPFTGTMIVGYYGGTPIFVEPMITREKLMHRESFELEMPAVSAPEGVHYPTRVRFDYDATDDAYKIVFSGF